MRHDSSDARGRSPQRGGIAVVVADISGSSAYLSCMEAEEFADLLAAFRAIARRTMERHGGVLVRSQADGVMAMFGYDTATENIGRRAIEATIDLHDETRDDETTGAVRLLLHSGIHYGSALVDVGDLTRGAFDLIGEVPTLADRLCKLAGPGQILVSQEALSDSRAFFQIEEPRTVELKGFAATPAARVLGRIGVGRRRYDAALLRGLAPLHGREAVLAQLRGVIEREVELGRPACVALVGPAGIGKTRLLEEFCRTEAARRCRVLRGFCESYLAAEVLQPFRQILREVLQLEGGGSGEERQEATREALRRLGWTDEDPGPWRVLALGTEDERPIRSPTASEAATPASARDLICRLLERLTQAGPVLLVLDDWQWSDDSSRLVLESVWRLALPVTVLLASRVDEPDVALPSRAVTFKLEPIAEPAGVRLVQHLVPRADPLTAEEIVRYSGGNPLFLEEICHSLRDAGSVEAWRQRIGSSASLSMLIEARFGRLKRTHARIVQTAAAIGNVVPRSLLAGLAREPLTEAILDSLGDADILYASEPDGALRFKHGLTRDVIYGTIGLRTRIDLHTRIAAQLRSQRRGSHDRLEALAYHCDAAGLSAEAADHAEAAGAKAMADYALDRARAQYFTALKALDRLATLTPTQRRQWCRIAERLGMVCVFDPLSLHAGIGLFERALALAVEEGDEALIVRARYWLGYVAYAKGWVRFAIGHCGRALDEARAVGDVRLTAQLQAALGQALIAGAEYDQAKPHVDAAIGVKKGLLKPGSTAAIGLAYTLSCRALMIGDRGDFQAAEVVFAQALELLDTMQHPVAASVRGWHATVLLWQGRWAEAAAIAGQAAHISEQTQRRHLLAMDHVLTGYAQWQQTRDPAALDRIAAATRWIEARRGTFSISLNYGFLVDGYAARGDAEAVRAYVACLHRRARQHDWLGYGLGCRAYAAFAARRGEWATSERYLRLARKAAEVRQSRHEQAANALCGAQIDRLRGDFGAAMRVALEFARTEFAAMAMPWHLQEAKRVIEEDTRAGDRPTAV